MVLELWLHNDKLESFQIEGGGHKHVTAAWDWLRGRANADLARQMDMVREDRECGVVQDIFLWGYLRGKLDVIDPRP